MRWLKQCTLQKVLVHTRDDRTIEGALSRVGRDGLVLLEARYHDGGGQVPMAGHVYVPREQVAFVQVP